MPVVTEDLLEATLPCLQTKEVQIWDEPLSKIYTYDRGRFPIQSRSENQYVMIAYHCNFNTILYAA